MKAIHNTTEIALAQGELCYISKILKNESNSQPLRKFANDSLGCVEADIE